MIVVAGFAALVAALSLLLSGTDEIADHRAADASAGARGTQARETDLARDPSPGERTTIVSGDPALAASDRATTVELEIVAADTRAPLPGASVRAWPKQLGDGERGFEAWLRHSALEMHEAEAPTLVADERGRVRVAGFERGFHVAASSGGLFGTASFDAPPPAPAVVALAPDRTLLVRVVGADGAPVGGVPVALRLRRMSRRFDVLDARTSPSDGVARLRHAGQVLDSEAGSAPEFVLGVQGLFDPPIEAPLERALALGEPLELALPPSGSCEVVVVDLDGRPVRGPLDVRLGFGDAGPSGHAPPWSENRLERDADAVVFEQVALGRELVASVVRESSSTTLEARGSGPVQQGERVVLRVPLGSGAWNLRGRLLGAAGVPLAGATARAQLESGDGRARFETTWPLSTGVDGRFALELPASAAVKSGMVLALHRLGDDGAELSVARRTIHPELDARVLDLGDFLLAETPVAIRGRVVDAAGHGIEGAEVVPALAFEPDADPLEAAPRAPWLQPVRSGEGGKFELRCEPWPMRLTLEARKNGLVGQPEAVELGARDVRLVLRAGGAIAGRVLLDPSLQAAIVLVEAFEDELLPGAPPVARGTPAVVARDGAFAIEALRSAPHSIRVIDAATGTELGRVEGIEVRAGEAARDPRCDPLDLRERFRLLCLELQDEDGAQVREARALSRPSDDGDAKWTAATRSEGRLLLLTDGRPLLVAVTAAGFQDVLRERQVSSEKIVLRRALRLRFQLEGGLRGPALPLALALEVTPVDRGLAPGLGEGAASTFDQRGELVCQVGFSGAARIELSVSSRPGTNGRHVLQGVTPRVIQIGKGAGEQVFGIAYDAAELEAAERTLRDGR
ncbi:MAG TPA: hypothetical protein VM509_09680 [Planctomycetota bacterium]|nr:hypothetical protein [Planctomycetota bacterium]